MYECVGTVSFIVEIKPVFRRIVTSDYYDRFDSVNIVKNKATNKKIEFLLFHFRFVWILDVKEGKGAETETSKRDRDRDERRN